MNPIQHVNFSPFAFFEFFKSDADKSGTMRVYFAGSHVASIQYCCGESQPWKLITFGPGEPSSEFYRRSFPQYTLEGCINLLWISCNVFNDLDRIPDFDDIALSKPLASGWTLQEGEGGE